MADAQSDADKIRNKRLAKLGGPSSASSNAQSSSNSESAPSADPATAQQSTPDQARRTPDSERMKPPAAANPFSQLGMQSERKPGPNIKIRPATDGAASRDPANNAPSQPRPTQSKNDMETWEDRTLSGIFRFTLYEDDTRDAHGNKLYYLPGVKSELEESGSELKINAAILDQAILEAATIDGHPLPYLLACWKRVTRIFRGFRSATADDPKLAVVSEAKRLCMSYSIFSATMPEMFGLEPTGRNPLAEHFLADPDHDNGLCHDFLREAVSRFPEDDTIREALVEAIEQLSRDLSKMSMNDNFKPYIAALRNFVRYPPLVDAMTQSPVFLPENIEAPQLEQTTLLGPFFRISPLQPEVALDYFMGGRTRDEGFLRNSQNALRMTLRTHQDDLFDIVDRIVKTGRDSREILLDWFALTVNKNHKRRATWIDEKTVSSDGFMVNVTTILDRLCEPFMDATFAKVDRIDVDYFRRSPRVLIQDETKMNADQKTSDEFWSGKPAEGSNNFITEIFFLTVAAHHYGTEATNAKVSQLTRELKHLEKQVTEMEKERPKFMANPTQLTIFDTQVKKYKDKLEQGHCMVRAIQGVLLDEVSQQRSMLFMRYVIVWLLRIAVPGSNYPKQQFTLPLPEEQPLVWKCLPDYLIEDMVDNFKFITANMPHIIMSTQCEELITICITFLRNSHYIHNPGVKSGLVTILFSGVWGFRGRAKGVLGDLLNSMPFALKNLLRSLMNFYIEAENTGSHTQFYDKFTIRYEIFKVIQCIWTNSVYRNNLDKESKVNTEFFVKFVNLMLNDVTYVLDESFSAFRQIHILSLELEAPTAGTLDPQVKQEKEEELQMHKGRAKSYMQLTNETIAMLKMFTEALADAFTTPEVVQRLADMMDYNLDSLTGKKQKELKVDNPQQYGFVPGLLLSDLTSIYLNLKDKTNFHHAIARDGRSYKPFNFENAARILTNSALKSPKELKEWNELAAVIAKVKEEMEEEDLELGEPPDEFVDPLLATIMEDPVILPMSRTVIDRSTIRQHLLSDPVDPFNRAPLKIEDVIPDTELKARIQEWKDSARRDAKARKEHEEQAREAREEREAKDRAAAEDAERLVVEQEEKHAEQLAEQKANEVMQDATSGEVMDLDLRPDINDGGDDTPMSG